MKYMKQFLVILAVTCIAEFIKFGVPLPVPASIYGLLIMFLLLVTKVVQLTDVGETAHFLIEIMPLMFIPAAVGLVTVLEELQTLFLPVVVITVSSTIIVMVSAGKVTQRVVERKKK